MVYTVDVHTSTVQNILSVHNFPLPTNPVGRLASESYALPCPHVALARVENSSTRRAENNRCALAIDAVFTAYDYIAVQEAARIIAARSLRDDIIQEARVGLWKAANKYIINKDPHFHNFARRVVRNALLDHIKWIQRDDIRREQAHMQSAYANILETVFGCENEGLNHAFGLHIFTDHELCYDGLIEKFRELFYLLHQRTQSFLWLHYVDDWSMRAIAKEFNLSVSRVHAIISKSKLHLRESLIQYYY